MNVAQRMLILVALAAATLGHEADAQGRARGGGGGRRDMIPPAGELPPGGRGAEQALRREIRQRFDEVVRRQLALTDDQSRQLKQIEEKYNRQRGDVTKDEREARQTLGAMLADTTAAPDAAKVDQYLTRLVQAQRKRADLLEAEQKDLAAFLNPVQRAKYMGLREQLRAKISELQRAGRRGGEPPPP